METWTKHTWYEIHFEATVNLLCDDDDGNRLIGIGSALSSKADPQMMRKATGGGIYWENWWREILRYDLRSSSRWPLQVTDYFIHLTEIDRQILDMFKTERWTRRVNARSFFSFEVAVGGATIWSISRCWVQISVGILGENTQMVALLRSHDLLPEWPQPGG